jgi:hypothetical protein
VKYMKNNNNKINNKVTLDPNLFKIF